MVKNAKVVSQSFLGYLVLLVINVMKFYMVTYKTIYCVGRVICMGELTCRFM
jgi:hypothetical protein